MATQRDTLPPARRGSGNEEPSQASDAGRARGRGPKVALLALSYAWFPVIFALRGEAVAMGVLMCIPVYVGSWLFGPRGGLAVMGVTLPLATLFLNGMGMEGTGIVFERGGLLAMGVLAVGVLVVGRLGELSARVGAQALALALERATLQAEIADRQRVEEALRASEERYRLMVEGSEQLFFYVHDAQHRFEYLSPSVSAVMGYEAAELLGQPYDILLADDPANAIVGERTDSALQTGERSAPYLALGRHKDGRLLRVEVVETPVEADGTIVGMRGFARDVTERHRAEQLRTVLYEVSEAVHQTPDLPALFESVHRSLGRLVDTRNFFIALCDEADADLFHFAYVVDEKDGHGTGHFHLPRSLTAFIAHTGQPRLLDRDQYEALIASGQVVRFGTPHHSWLGVPLRQGDQKIGVVVLQSYDSARAYTGADIEMMQFVADQIASAIQRKRAEQALQESQTILHFLAHHDPLTRLPNRMLFYDRLEQALADARRDERPLALLYVDLDDFKAVNDRWGHDTGDALLREVSARLLACAGERGTVARMGGDEFTLILPTVNGSTCAVQGAQCVLDALTRPFEFAGQAIKITTSVGVALFPDESADGEALIRHADRAMYRAKEVGKNRFFAQSHAPTGLGGGNGRAT